MYEYSACMYVNVLCPGLVPTEVKSSIWLPWNWRCGWIGATMWGLATEPKYSVGARSTMNCWVITTASENFYWKGRWFSKLCKYEDQILGFQKSCEISQTQNCMSVITSFLEHRQADECSLWANHISQVW